MRPPDRAFAREGLLARAAPFGGLALLAFLVVPLPPAASGEEVRAAQALTAFIFACVAFVPWERLPRVLEVLPPIAYLVVVGFLRDAEGGAISGVSPLVLIPVVWVALYGTRAHLVAVVAAVAGLFFVPLAFLDAASYPNTEWERVILWTAACAMVGYTVYTLVGRTRVQAERLESMVRIDELTGMPNGLAWEESLAEELRGAASDGAPVSIAVLELDAFQLFHKQNGRELSERLLRACASVWLHTLDSGDLLARNGGPEFRLLLPRASLRQAVERVEQLREATPARQSCSIGVACWDGVEGPGDLVARADAAVQEAKRRGHDRTMVATQGAPMSARDALEVTADP